MSFRENKQLLHHNKCQDLKQLSKRAISVLFCITVNGILQNIPRALLK